MNTQGKIDLALDPARLYLHQEGIFYKLYDLHALLFTDNSSPTCLQRRFSRLSS